MKTILFTLGLALASTSLQAQENMKHWAISAGIQNHMTLRPSTHTIKFYQFQGFGVNGRYMINKNIGVTLGVNYGLLDFQGQGTNNQNLIRTNLQGVLDLGSMFNFANKTDKFGLLFHAGIGTSHLFSKAGRDEDPQDVLFKNTDDMFNVNLGITPSVNINDMFSIFLDYTLTANSSQRTTFDRTKLATDKTFNGGLSSLMVGVAINF